MVQIPEDNLPYLYALLMEEIKLRVAMISTAFGQASERAQEPDGFLYAETCYLQVRRIAELIALAVLTAHNRLEEFRTKSLVKSWNADTLFRALAELSKDSFPAPVSVVDRPSDTHMEVLVHRGKYMTRDKLAKIYNSCGDYLHAGSLRRLVQDGRKIYDLAEIESWTNDIVLFLAQHIITLPEMKSTMLVSMASAPNGQVHCVMSDLVGELESQQLVHSAYPPVGDIGEPQG